MPFVPFIDMFSEIGTKETRSAMSAGKNSRLPMEMFHFVELYCNDKDCDCRKVMFSVTNENGTETMATIEYGWEPQEFYEKWLGIPDDEWNYAQNIVKGTLVDMAPQGEQAGSLLELFQNTLLTWDYVERLKRHYQMFREAIEKSVPLTIKTVRPPSRNQPCPCGSGRKYKNCCAMKN